MFSYLRLTVTRFEGLFLYRGMINTCRVRPLSGIGHVLDGFWFITPLTEVDE